MGVPAAVTCCGEERRSVGGVSGGEAAAGHGEREAVEGRGISFRRGLGNDGFVPQGLEYAGFRSNEGSGDTFYSIEGQENALFCFVSLSSGTVCINTRSLGKDLFCCPLLK